MCTGRSAGGCSPDWPASPHDSVEQRRGPAERRGASTTPAQAVESLTGIHPPDEQGQQRLNTAAHWGYGTALGGERGLLALTGVHGPAATAAHVALVWGASHGVLPALDVSPPTWRFGASATAVDVFHHAVYATATGLAYDWLDARAH